MKILRAVIYDKDDSYDPYALVIEFNNYVDKNDIIDCINEVKERLAGEWQFGDIEVALKNKFKSKIDEITINEKENYIGV